MKKTNTNKHTHAHNRTNKINTKQQQTKQTKNKATPYDTKHTNTTNPQQKTRNS